VTLGLAIGVEVIGTSFLKVSEGFTKLWPSAIASVSYAISIYLVAVSLKQLPVGIAYAIWSGTGLFLVVLIGWLILGQRLDVGAIVGMTLIVIGVVVINLFSAAANQ
jgi:small multidrug resistance pump